MPAKSNVPGDGRAHRGLAGLAEIFRRQRVEFSGGAREHLRLRGRAIRGDVAESARPDRGWLAAAFRPASPRSSHPRCSWRLNFSCFVTSRWPSLQDSVISAGACSTAPASGSFPRRSDFKQRVVGGRFLLRIVERQRKRPASGLLRGIGMDQIERARRLVIVGKFLELPASHHAAAIGNFNAIQIAFDHDGAFPRSRRAWSQVRQEAASLWLAPEAKWKQFPAAARRDSW